MDIPFRRLMMTQLVLGSGRKHIKTMKRNLMFGVALLFGLATLAPPIQAELQVGDKAPDFTLPGSDGKSYQLSQFAGKQAVVIAWYPKAFTGG